uniref:LPXTG cell wall anchor domain-containing protein n=1 Tax=Streptomyces sp. NBC_00093 TaxID=2975649 RepID=A0AAU2A3S6_9ACTN
MENRADTAFKGVELSLHKIGYLDGPDFLLEIMEYIDIQRRDAKTHAWVDVPFVDYGGTGYLPDLDLPARKTTTLDLRMSVDKDIPMPVAYPGSDYAESGYIGGGSFWARTKRPGDDGGCLYAQAKNLFFDVYESGTDTGEGGGTKPPSSSEPTPQAGTTAPVDPSSSATTTPTGDLAHTGSSSALPVIAGAGAVAVGLGAGAVYVVRRRRAEPQNS